MKRNQISKLTLATLCMLCTLPAFGMADAAAAYTANATRAMQATPTQRARLEYSPTRQILDEAVGGHTLPIRALMFQDENTLISIDTSLTQKTWHKDNPHNHFILHATTQLERLPENSYATAMAPDRTLATGACNGTISIHYLKPQPSRANDIQPEYQNPLLIQRKKTNPVVVRTPTPQQYTPDTIDFCQKYPMTRLCAAIAIPIIIGFVLYKICKTS